MSWTSVHVGPVFSTVNEENCASSAQYDLENQGVFVKHYAPGGNNVQKAIFSFKFKV